jgi:hypothetical protein
MTTTKNNKIKRASSAAVAHTCNHSCWGAEMKRIVVQSQPRQRVCKNTFQPIIVPSDVHLSSQATQRLGLEGSWFQTSLNLRDPISTEKSWV